MSLYDLFEIKPRLQKITPAETNLNSKGKGVFIIPYYYYYKLV